jgi:hypothetical protein
MAVDIVIYHNPDARVTTARFGSLCAAGAIYLIKDVVA